MNLSRLRVLLVDDDEDDYVIVRDLLSDIKAGVMDVEWVATYEEAYVALTEWQYDVCLLDYHLGSHTGLQLLQAMPAENPIPTILLTGSEDYQIDVAAAEAGASDYLVKEHINAPLLERSIRYAIQRKISETALRQAQRFAQATVDALPDSIAVIDEEGVIVAVNAAWRNLVESESCANNDLVSASNEIGANYLAICDGIESEEVRAVARGIRAVMAGGEEIYFTEYSSQSALGERWFEMRVKRFLGSGPLYLVIAHEEITARKLAEQQIQIHSHLLNIIGQAVIVTDPNGIITYWNSFAEKLYGWSASEALGRDCTDLTPFGATRQQGAEILARVAQGENWAGEFLLQKRDGTNFLGFITNTPVLDRDGQVSSIVGLSFDITERKRVEERLQQSEANLAQAQKIAHLGSWELAFSDSLDIEGNLIQNQNMVWSDEVFRIFGYEPGQVEVSTDFMLEAVHPDDRARVREMGMQAQRDKTVYSLDHRIIRPDGTERVVHQLANFIYDSAGQWIKMFGIVHDITERKQAEDLLREREEFQRALLENFPNGSVNVFDRDLRYVMAAGRNLKESGMIPSELPGKSVHEIFSPEQVALATSYYQSVVDGNTVEFEMPHKRRFFNINAAPLRDRADVVANILVVAQDITARKQAEEALEATTRAIVATWESMTDAFYSLDAEWRFTHTNSQANRLLGYSSEELMGKVLWQAFPETIGLKFDTEYRRAAEEQVAVNFEEFFAPHKKWYEVHAYPSPVGLSVYFRDISERKQSEEALRISIERFEILSRATNDAVWDWNLRTDELWWNEGFETLFGYTRESIEPDASSWKARMHPEDLHRVSEGIHGVIETRTQYWSDEYRFRRVDGSYAVIFDRGFVIRDADGTPLRMVGSMQDISERKQAEEALRASEERFQSIVFNVPGMVYQFVKHPDGSIEWPFVSNGCQDMFEVDAEAIKANPHLPLNLIHPEDKREFENSMTVSEQTLAPWIWEGRLRLPSGKNKWVQGASSPQRLPDGGTLCTGLLMDITDRKEAESQRDRFFTMSLDMLSIADFQGRFKRLNPAFTEILGYSEAELIARPFLEFVHPDDREATQQTIKDLTQGNFLIGFTNRYRSKDGSWRWLEWKSVAIVEEGIIYAAARDVTERRVAEAALLRANDALEERVASRTAELERANEALQFQIIEREGAEAETRTRARQQQAVAELGRQALSDMDMDTLLQGAAALVAATLDVEFSSVLELMPGGEALRFRANSGWSQQENQTLSDLLMPADSQSQSGYALLWKAPLIVTDLRTETRFEPSPFLLKSGIVSGVKVVIGSYEEPFGTLGAHTTHQREFTQNDVNFLQAIANVLAAALDRYKVESEIRQLNTQLGQTNEQLRIENIEHQVTMASLHLAAAAHREAKEDAERATLAKSEFLSRMSHELRTPLNAILGFGQILDRQELSALQTESVGHILKGGRHLLGLINEVLDIARVEAGHNEFSIEPVSLAEVVAECCALMQPLADERHIRLIDNSSPRESSSQRLHVLADRQRLKQVLINLLSNAIKYNRAGGEVTLWGEAVSEERGEERIQLRVQDSGFGLSGAEMKKLFTPFERLGAADSQIEGTGLGLVISQRLVAAMGGTLGVESVSESERMSGSISKSGSTFWVELPAAPCPLETLAEVPPVPAEAPADAPRSYTVLSIEDNVSNIRLLEAILSSRPEINLQSAMQGQIGLELAQKHLPDLVLLDLHLPGLSGLEVLRELQRGPETREIPVIIISADATPKQIEQLLSQGAAAYLTKPLNVAHFLQQIEQTLKMNPTHLEALAGKVAK